MGWCREFGCQIVSGCDHSMVAGEASCSCQQCDFTCTGKFSGCADVWAKGVNGDPNQPLVEVARTPALVSDGGSVNPFMAGLGGGWADDEPKGSEGGSGERDEPDFFAPGADEGGRGGGGFWPESDPTEAPAWGEGPQIAQSDEPSDSGYGSYAEHQPDPGHQPYPMDSPVHEDPGPGADPAAVIVAWLKRGFDGLHLELERVWTTLQEQRSDLFALTESQAALSRMADAQAILTQAIEAQSSELNVSLAELEGCAGQLRNETASLQGMRAELSVAYGAMLLEMREALAAELPAKMAGALEPLITKALTDLTTQAREIEQRVEEIERRARARSESLTAELRALVAEAAQLAGGRATSRLPVAGPAATPSVAVPPRPDPVPPTSPDADPSQPLVPDAEPPPVPEESPSEPPAEATPQARPATEQRPRPAVLSSPAESPDATDDDLSELPASEVTCVTGGLAVGPSIAVAMTGALERARVSRRRRRTADTPRAGLHRQDPHAGEVLRRLERFAAARGDKVFEKRSAESAPELRIAAGEYGGHEFAIDLSVLGCLCLAGAHSRSVARALALSLLSQPGRFSAQVLAVGDMFDGADLPPGAVRVADTSTALDRVEAEIEARRKRLAEDGADNAVAYNRRHPDEPIGPLLLVTARLAEGDGARLKASMSDSGQLALAAVAVDAVLDGSPSLQLRAGGVVEALQPEATLGGLIGARLFLVGSQAASELLGVLSEAADVEGPRPEEAEPVEAPFAVPDPPGEVPIQVQLLGSYRIEAAGKEIRSGLRAKARELLSFYLLHPEGTTLDSATQALWPEADAGRGSEWFWTALGNLRSLLRNTTGLKELKVIEREGDIYRIEPIFDVDLWRMQQALSEAGVSGDHNGASELWAECLQRAADLYAGDLLDGVDWAWAKAPREDLRCRAVDVLVAYAASRLTGGDVRGALDVLQRALEVDPLSEHVYRRIMRLHAKLERPDAVTATYRRLETKLGEVGLEPLPETRKLHSELAPTA